jgi:outer membrane protein TolC
MPPLRPPFPFRAHAIGRAAAALRGACVLAMLAGAWPAATAQGDGLGPRSGVAAPAALSRAATANARGATLTLAELGRLAVVRPSAFAVARAEQSAEAARLEQARATRRPTLAFEASLQRQRAEGATTTADVTGGASTTSQLRLALGWSLLDPARAGRIDAQARLLRAAGMASDEARTQLFSRLFDAYVGAAVADEETALVEAQIEGLREQAARSSRRLAAGVDTRLDALEVDAFLEALSAERARLRGERELRRAELQRLSGLAAEPDAWLRAEWPQALRDDALGLWSRDRRNTEVERLRAISDAAAARAEAERSAAGLPTIALNASVGRLQQKVGTLRPPASNESQLGASLQWPLDLDGSRRAQVEEARAQSARERAALDDALLRIEGDWRSAAVEYEQAQRQLDAQQRAAEIARQTLEATQRAYIAGLRSGLDVLNASQRSADAQRAALRTRAAMLQALARATALSAPWDEATLQRLDMAFMGRPR